MIDLSLWLDKTLDLKHSPGTNVGGHVVENFSTTQSSIPCCVYPVRSSTVRKYSSLMLDSGYEIITAVDIGATAGDIIIVAGQTYTVQGYEKYVHTAFGSLYLTVTSLKNT